MTEFHPAPRVSGRKTALATRIAQAVYPVITGLRNWRERQLLGTLLRYDNDRLTDMGITRDDIRAVLKLPLSRNPALELERRRSARR